jgi:protein-export membrane protein SecD
MKYHRSPTSKYAQQATNTRGKTYFTVALTTALFALAAWFVLGSYSPFKLGLDLQGGTHLVYEADMAEVVDGEQLSALEGVKDVVERRVNAFGVSEPVVQTTVSGDSYRVIIELAGVLDVNEAINLIGETPILEFKEPSDEPERQPTEEELLQLEEMNTLERADAEEKLNQALAGEELEYQTLEKVTENSYLVGSLIETMEPWYLPGKILPDLVETEEGLNVVRLDAVEDGQEMQLSQLLICFEGKPLCNSDRSALDASILINNLKEQATAENFADLANENTEDPSGKGNGGDLDWVSPGQLVPAFELAAAVLEVNEISGVVETEYGYHLVHKRDTRDVQVYDLSRFVMPYSTITDIVPPMPWKNTELSGRHLTRASIDFDQTSGQPYVSISFNSDGDNLFGDLTERLVGQPMAIFLDGELITAPVVQTAIYGGQAVITGQYTVDEAKLLAQRLNAGALPVPLELMSQQTVGPTLGQISLEKSIVAALIGFALLAIYMVAYYRLPGLLAVLALIFYTAFNLAVYKALDVTITLAGIAGFILSMGMAVDANVLIFERFREELRAGRDVLGAIDEGFRRAWTSIRDGNLTTLIAAAVLFWFSTSFIKGFALTLSLGILLSMFTAITVTRVWLRLIAGWKWAKPLALYGVKRKE